MSTRINYKTVNNSQAKGIIVTSETIMDLRSWLRSVNASPEGREGAKVVIDFLEDSYKKGLGY